MLLTCSLPSLPPTDSGSPKDHSQYRNCAHRRKCTLHSWNVSGKGDSSGGMESGRGGDPTQAGALHSTLHSRRSRG